MKNKRSGFTFLELVFVIVILAIIAKFGVEFLAQAYRNYLYDNLTTKLSERSERAVEFIAKRLQYRIRPSVIVRKSDGSFKTLEGFGSGASAQDYKILEWIGYDIDGFREGLWSGIIDKEASVADGVNLKLDANRTDLNAVDSLIKNLSPDSTMDIDGAALFLFAAESDVRSGYGWDGTAIPDQTLKYAMHPINKVDAHTLSSGISGHTFAELYNDIKAKGTWDGRYYLAWTAYAVELDSNNDLIFHYDYQPWNGEKYSDATTSKVVLMKNVSTFKMIQKQGVIKIQVCTANDMSGSSSLDMGGFSICKEKTIY